jgi:hypothetical protein
MLCLFQLTTGSGQNESPSKSISKPAAARGICEKYIMDAFAEYERDEFWQSSCDEARALQLLKVTQSDTKTPELNFDAMRKTKESGFQPTLTSWGTTTDSGVALDTSCIQDGVRYPSFSDTQHAEDGKSWFPNSAKFDLWAQWFAGALEMKDAVNISDTAGKPLANTYATLLQALQRVSVLMRMHGWLKRGVAFAVTPNASYMVIAYREGTQNKRLSVQQVETSDVPRLFHLASLHARQNPDWFITNSGKVLVNCLKTMDINPMFTRTVVFAESQSEVYSVTLPRGDQERVQLVVDSERDSAHFLVKVINAEEDAKREIKFTKMAKPEHVLYVFEQSDTKTANEYVLTSVCDEVDTTTQEGNEADANSPIQLTAKAKTTHDGHVSACHAKFSDPKLFVPPYLKNLPCTGGALVMMKGFMMSKDEDGNYSCPIDTTLSTLSGDIERCLHKYHNADVVHADVRPSNIVYFEQLQRYVLIDLGLSARVSTEANYHCLEEDSSQWKYASHRVRNAQEQFLWTVCDDFAMWAQCLYKVKGLSMDFLTQH